MGALVSTTYVPPGAFIGQLITPSPAAIPNEARIPCFVGRGSRLARGANLTIRRSFVSGESLNFSTLAPHVATLDYPANGDKQAARLFKQDGTEVRRDQWVFQAVGNSLLEVVINTEVYDPNASYSIDYQSTSREVKDPIPVEDIRTIEALGTSVDQPEFEEFTHYLVETDVTNPAGDASNGNPDSSLEAPVADGGNTSTGTVTQASSSEFAHNYTRYYSVSLDSVTTGVQATGSITTVVAANIVEGETFFLNDGINAETEFVFDKGTLTPGAGQVVVDISGDTTADEVKTTLIGVITGVGSSLLITATDGGANTVTLTHDRFTATGNVTPTADTVTDGGFVVTAMASGVSRAVGLAWNAQPISPGNSAAAPVPLHSGMADPVLTVTDTDGEGSVDQALELGVVLTLDFGSGAAEFVVSDSWTFNGLGPALFERNARYANTNQFASVNAPVADGGNTGTGGVTLGSDTDYTGSFNTNYTLEVTAVAGTTPNRTATIRYAEHGDRIGVEGVFSLDETSASSTTGVNLNQGIELDFSFGATNFVVGDKFTIAALAPQLSYAGKDNRAYTMQVSTATNASAGVGVVTGTFTTDTPEGGFGSFTATGNSLAPSSPSWESGHFELPNSILLAARNLFSGPTSTAQGNQHTATDEHTFAATNEGVIDWGLQEMVSETIEQSEIRTDVSGGVTGTPNTKYIILANVPDTVESVVTSPGGTPVSYVHVTDTPYITFPTDPASALVVEYTYRSAEPNPGQVYYLTGNFLRPAELYNTPLLVSERQEGRDLLAPASAVNHLYIMNEIAWDNGVPGVYFVQVNDPDDDGIYSNSDFKAAIDASEAPSRVSDITVLSNFGSLGDLLASVTRMNDPFERRERIAWIGAPIGTPIGDADTSGTLVYLAKNTLQVFGNSPAHGTRVLAGSTQATRDLRLEDGTTIEVTLDGSFIAGALASLTASFTDPGETILRKNLAGFKTLETFGDLESPQNATLGGNDVIFMTDQGGSVFRIEEDITVDTFAEDFHLINNMTQKQFVTRFVRGQTDSNLVGVVVPSAAAGVGLVKGFVASSLTNLVTRGIIGQYQDENGNERPLNPDSDVVVFRDQTDSTLYHFFYAFYLRNTIKRLFGLFTVNTNDFGLRRA